MKTKECRWRDHEGKRRLSIDQFSTNRRRADGRHPYCKACARAQVYAFREKKREITLIQRAARANAVVQPVPLLPEQRVLFAIKEGARTQWAIRRKAKVMKDELGNILAQLILVEGKVATRIKGNDEREYFIKAA